MKQMLLGCLLIVLGSLTASAQEDTTSIAKTHWLIGTWKGTHNNKPFYETWRKRADNSLICFSISINGSDTTVKLNSTIGLKDGTVVFEDPLVWKAKRLMNNEMTFEMTNNKGKQHRIVWMKTTDDHWWAILQYPASTLYFDLVLQPELDRTINKFLPK